ncbi:MAG: pyruvate ferredoxin oxidoreductase, partial [Thermococcus sp.]
MPIRTVMKANEAAAWAAKLAKPKVIAAFPITPSTLVPEKISEFVANGELDAEFIKVESEHSAISACVGASAAGVRTFTATASQGLALMHEVLFIAAGMRLPIVMAIGNRSLSAPINIWNDWQDSISERDTGWLQFYAENNQEALDLILIAYKVAEDERVLLPAMVGFDAFILTHTVEPVEIPDQELVDEFLGEYEPKHAYLDPKRPITQGTLAFPAHYMEARYTVWEANENARKVIDEAFAEFEKKF